MDVDYSKGCNAFNVAFFPKKCLVYFEKHKIFEIYEDLFRRIAKDEPYDIEQYIMENLQDIADEHHIIKTLINAPPMLNAHDVAKEYSKLYKTPIIQYTKERVPGDTDIIVSKLKKFLTFHGLLRKHLVMFNFPKEREEILKINQTFMKPNNFIEIVPTFQVPFKTLQQREDEDAMYLQHFKQINDYYRNRIRKLYVGNSKCVENSILNNTDICRNIHKAIRNQLPNERQIVKWEKRVLLIGRRGSGRKTQAALLAKKFNLIFIDVEFLILKHYQTEDDPIGEILRKSTDNPYSHLLIATIVYKRILEPDCIENGWIIVGYPNTVQDLIVIDENFLVPPNKIIFLHCRESLCRRRLEKNIYLCKKIKVDKCNKCEITDGDLCDCGCGILKHPRDAEDLIKSQLALYNQNIRPMVEYCKKRKETIHINGSHSVKTVKTQIWSMIEQTQIALL